jgi:nucleoid-associated protein YgaU
MTRENKLALVLGFGLMLFVGILVSDHLAASKAPKVEMGSTRRNQEIIQPMPAGAADEGMVIFGNGERILVRAEKPRGSGASEPVAPPQAPLPQQAQQSDEPVARTAPVPGPAAQPVRAYVVQEGDSFAAIARREYGRTSLGERLAAYNGVHPRSLRVGASIKLPPVEDLDPRLDARTASARAQSDAQSAPGSREYTVRRGDSLFAIAERELGRGSRWEELKRFNEDVLKGRDSLTPGMQIRIPVDA